MVDCHRAFTPPAKSDTTARLDRDLAVCSAEVVIDELRAVLRASEVPAPYLSVGHSLGPVYVQRFAQLFPAEVAGLLLLDPAHEDWDRYMPEQLKIANNQPADSKMPELPEEFLA